MVGSAQHELAKWLTEVLQPVTLKYSTYVIKDSFTFAGALQQSRDRTGHDLTFPNFMCSFDVCSLFTNVPLDVTIDICLDALYRSDLT